MNISTRSFIILLIVAIILVAAFGVLIYHMVKNTKTQQSRYKIDNNIGAEIDAVVEGGNEKLHEMVVTQAQVNQLAANLVNSNQLATNTVSANTVNSNNNSSNIIY